MVKYELIEKVDGGYLYRYFPNGDRNNPGIVFVRDGGKDGEIIKLSSKDEGHVYAGHAIYGIVPGEQEGTRAWY